MLFEADDIARRRNFPVCLKLNGNEIDKYASRERPQQLEGADGPRSSNQSSHRLGTPPTSSPTSAWNDRVDSDGASALVRGGDPPDWQQQAREEWHQPALVDEANSNPAR